MFLNLFDSHTHSINSPDGNDSVIEMCKSAERKGLMGLAITDHCEANLYHEGGYDRRVKKSFRDITTAGEIFQDRMVITHGIELGQPMQGREAAEQLLADTPFDFVIGSLHSLPGGEDLYYVNFSEHPEEVPRILESYYEEIYEMAKWNRFDVIGHLTYPLRYIQGVHKIEVDMRPYEERIAEILKVVALNGKGIEINTSGLRQPLRKTMPDERYVQIFRDYGGQVITLGSDAHDAESIVLGIEDGMEMLRSLGCRYFAFFKEREPRFLHLV